MAYTTIDDPSAHFQITLWTGDDSTDRAITNNGNSNLQPDLVWIKCRNDTFDHVVVDSQRGASTSSTGTQLSANLDAAEPSNTNGHVKSFNSDGFNVRSGSSAGNPLVGVNKNAKTYVAWQWKANGGSATATGSESGSNPAYSAQANQTAGFSIITYTGTGSEGDVTHGLGGKPDFIIIKNRTDGSTPWPTWHKDFVDADADNGAYAYINTTGEDQATSVFYEGDAISSSVVALKGGNANVNADGKNYVMYCWRSIKGYSKFGRYDANNNAFGPYIHCGFKPKFIVIKKATAVGEWHLLDVTRERNDDTFPDSYGPTNTVDKDQYWSGAYSEGGSAQLVDFLANGFKLRNNHTGSNGENTNEDFVFMAWAEFPFVSSEGIPATAG